jgi:hypothetical protein
MSMAAAAANSGAMIIAEASKANTKASVPAHTRISLMCSPLLSGQDHFSPERRLMVAVPMPNSVISLFLGQKYLFWCSLRARGGFITFCGSSAESGRLHSRLPAANIP